MSLTFPSLCFCIRCKYCILTSRNLTPDQPESQPTRKRKTTRIRRKRGGMNALTPYHGRRHGKSAWPGIKQWFKRSAVPWMKTQLPKIHKHVKDNKLISRGIRNFANSHDFGEKGNFILPALATGVDWLGYGKRRRGAKMVKYRKKGRGLNHTGGKCKKYCRRRKRK